MNKSRATNAIVETKLQELARLRRKAQYAEEQVRIGRASLARLQIGNDMLLRLSWTMRSRYLELVEYIKVESSMARRDFTESYGEIMSLADHIIEQVESKTQAIPRGFTHALSSGDLDSVLAFLNLARRDHQWVAQRLSALSASEIESFLPAAELGFSQASILRETNRAMDKVDDLHRSDLLFTLVFGLFATPGVSNVEHELQLGLSTTILFQLIQDSKTSSKADKLCLSIIDSWSAMYGWTAAKHFETLLLDILHTGTQILERADTRLATAQSSSRGYFHGSQKPDELEEEFFSNSLRRILKLVDTQEIGGVPHGALLLGSSILKQTSESDRRHYETFIIVNWFFYRFLSRVITMPEVRWWLFIRL